MNRPIVYVSCAQSCEIQRFELSPDCGALRPLGTTPVPGIQGPSNTSMPLAASPDRRVLHAALRGASNPCVSFTIAAPDGALQPIGSAPLPHEACYLTVDRSGRHLLMASYPGALLASLALDARGAAIAPPRQIVPTGPAAHCVIVDARNRFAYATSLGADVVMRFAFDAASGQLTDMQSTALAAGAGPRHLQLSADGRFLYVLCELDGSVGVFAVEADTGRLQGRQVLRSHAEGFNQAQAADLHLTPDGRFLYTSERRTHTLTGCRITPEDGLLTVAGAWPTEAGPRGFAIDPSGAFLLAAGQQSHHLSVYRIDPHSGALAAIGRYATGGNPNWIEIVDRPDA